MLRRAVWALGSGALVLLSSTMAHAQCTKDTDCKGDRVCEAGKCTSPAALPPAPPAPPAPSGAEAAPPAPVQEESVTLEEAPPAPSTEPAPAAAPETTAPPAAVPVTPAAVTSLGADEPEVRRRNRGMMIGGIVMVSIGPLALLGALSASNSQENCDQALESQYPDHVVPAYDEAALERCDSYTTPIYVLGIGGAILVGAGVPMIIYGAKNVPVKKQTGSTRLVPWATPRSGGLQLRVEL